jgi:hypothetical protein
MLGVDAFGYDSGRSPYLLTFPAGLPVNYPRPKEAWASWSLFQEQKRYYSFWQ